MADKYLSKYSNGKTVSPAQFITEIICERKAQSDKQDLHYRFWVHDKWAAFYKNQIASAHKLLKKNSPNAIIRALNTDTGKRIYSLRAPHLVAIIAEQEELLSKENTTFTKDITRSSDVKFTTSENKVPKNILSKLKDLDYGS